MLVPADMVDTMLDTTHREGYLNSLVFPNKQDPLSIPPSHHHGTDLLFKQRRLLHLTCFHDCLSVITPALPLGCVSPSLWKNSLSKVVLLILSLATELGDSDIFKCSIKHKAQIGYISSF
jgi:hypothetical protein